MGRVRVKAVKQTRLVWHRPHHCRCIALRIRYAPARCQVQRTRMGCVWTAHTQRFEQHSLPLSSERWQDAGSHTRLGGEVLADRSPIAFPTSAATTRERPRSMTLVSQSARKDFGHRQRPSCKKVHTVDRHSMASRESKHGAGSGLP